MGICRGGHGDGRDHPISTLPPLPIAVSLCMQPTPHHIFLPPLLQSFKFNDLEWSLWDRWILEGDLTVNQANCSIGHRGGTVLH